MRNWKPEIFCFHFPPFLQVDKMKALKNVSPLLSKQRGVVTHSCRYMGNKTVDPLKDLRDMCKNRGYIYPVISR